MTKRTTATSRSPVGAGLAPALGKVAALAKSLSRATSRLTQGTSTAQEALRSAEEVKTLLVDLTAATPDIDTLLADFTQRANTAFNALDADLRDALNAHGWHCDGQWPILYVQRAVCLQIDERARSAIVGSARIPFASVERIIEALQPLVEALVPHNFVAGDFMSELALAYDDAKGESRLVPIFDLYREFVVRAQKPRFWRDATGAKYVGVSADQFRARLTTALEQGVVASADRRQLRLLPPLDPKEGLFMYQPAEHRFGFVGRVEFLPAA